MIAATASVDWPALAAVGALLLAIFGALIRVAVVAAQLAQRVEDNTRAIERNARHLDGAMATMWPLIWRVQSIEDHLEERDRYRPPRLMSQPPQD